MKLEKKQSEQYNDTLKKLEEDFMKENVESLLEKWKRINKIEIIEGGKQWHQKKNNWMMFSLVFFPPSEICFLWWS